MLCKHKWLFLSVSTAMHSTSDYKLTARVGWLEGTCLYSQTDWQRFADNCKHISTYQNQSAPTTVTRLRRSSQLVAFSL